MAVQHNRDVAAAAESSQHNARRSVDGEVELRVPADPAYVVCVRMLVAGLGARCDLTIDDIEDLRIAVDEACALLLPHALAHSSLTARFIAGAGQLEVEVTVPPVAGAEIDRSGFAWTVLEALVAPVSVVESDDVLAVAMSKRREAQSQ